MSDGIGLSPPEPPPTPNPPRLLLVTLGLLAAEPDAAFAPTGLDDAGDVLVLRVGGTRKKPTAEIRSEVPPGWIPEEVEDGEDPGTSPLDEVCRRSHPPVGRPASIDFTDPARAAALQPALAALGVRTGTHAPGAADALHHVLTSLFGGVEGDEDPMEQLRGLAEQLGLDFDPDDPASLVAAVDAHFGHPDDPDREGR